MKPQLHLVSCNERIEQDTETPLEELAKTQASGEVNEPLPEPDGKQNRINTMLPILIGLTHATLFGLLVHAVYGTTGLPNEPWVYSVIWAMITTGAVISLLQMSAACLACRVFRKIQVTTLASRACGDCS
jgi:hypothetical protein